MPDAPTAPRDTYFIGVNGSMNPAIHHPQWYRTIGAIDEAELQAALRLPSQTSQLFSQVQLGAQTLMVTCQPDAWWIQSNLVESWPRMIEIASQVFARLNETPVSGYAFTAQRHIDTDCPDTKFILASSLSELHLGLPTGKGVASNAQISLVEEDFVVVASIQPSALSERAIYVFYQCQYQAPSVPLGTYFDLGTLLRGRFNKYQVEQGRVFREMVAAVNARCATGKEK